jgi:glutamyl-tRNA synthetase
MVQSGMRITRLAPSPTGALHLGNARTLLINWLLARQRGWRVLLRIEDIDGPRIKKGADLQAIEDLNWLGIDWDEGPIYQSSRLGVYRQAIDELHRSGSTYPCICTRSEVASAASAPHGEEASSVYPGTCRGRFESVAAAAIAVGRPPAIRFAIPEGLIEFDDRLAGHQQFDAARQLGDFVIAKADGTPAYQLAVVVDDAAMGVTDVVRGDDLLDSTPRQMLIYRALEMADRIPDYYHLPLIKGPDGRRLAKRHGDTRLSHYRAAGVPAGRVLALLARWSGVQIKECECSARDLIDVFDLSRLPRAAVTFTARDDAFLRG